MPDTTTKKVIDLRKGHPKPTMLPHAQMAAACRSAAIRLDSRSEAVLPLQYSKTEYGSPGYLKSLAAFLTGAYGSPVFDDWLLTTTGVSHGLELAVSQLTKPGDVCWMESPSYFLAYQIFADAQPRCGNLLGFVAAVRCVYLHPRLKWG